MVRVFTKDTGGYKVGDASPDNWSDPQWESFQRVHGPLENFSVTAEEAQRVGAETIAARGQRRRQ
ncbi:MAG TPA: hypothetical protein VGV13_13295 [Methylomirabilota bacterium]|jgi:hypothetical protein|nr:hypothetical protein [Methylomirabilota bacterium]